MPSILDFVRENKKAVIRVGDIDVQVVYNPNKMTMSRMSEITRRANAADVEAVAELIPEILESWDMEGPLVNDYDEELVPEGDVIPITFDNVVALPAMFVVAFSEKLQDLAMSGVNPTKGRPHSKRR